MHCHALDFIYRKQAAPLGRASGIFLSPRPAGSSGAWGMAGLWTMVDAILQTTDGVAPEQALNYWRHTALGGADIHTLPDFPHHRFEADRSYITTKAATFINNNSKNAGVIIERRVRHIRQDGLDQINFVLVRHGVAVRMHAGRTLVLGPGDLFIGDLTKPARLVTKGRYAEIRIEFPRSLFRAVVGDPERLVGRVFRVGHPLVDLIFQLAQQTQARVSDMTLEEAEAAFQALLVLARGLADTVGEPDVLASDAIVEAVRAHILRRLHDPSLDVDEILMRQRISRTRLYEALRPCGGVRAFIRDVRLDRIHAELSSGSQAPIGAVADIFGFPDHNQFSRAFRNRFAKTPSDVRASAKDKV
jgi:AraC-like DNA-binding protein